MQINSLWHRNPSLYSDIPLTKIIGTEYSSQKLLSENHGQVVWPVLCQQNRYTSVNGADTKSWAGKRWGGWETWADLHVDGKSIQAKNRWPTGNIHYGRRKINNAFRRDELVCLIRIRLSTDSTTDWYSFFSLFVSTLMEEQSRTLRLNTVGMIGVGKKRNTSSIRPVLTFAVRSHGNIDLFLGIYLSLVVWKRY